MKKAILVLLILVCVIVQAKAYNVIKVDPDGNQYFYQQSGTGPTNTFTPTGSATYTPTLTPTPTNTNTPTFTITPNWNTTNTPIVVKDVSGCWDSNLNTCTPTNTPVNTGTFTPTPTGIANVVASQTPIINMAQYGVTIAGNSTPVSITFPYGYNTAGINFTSGTGVTIKSLYVSGGVTTLGAAPMTFFDSQGTALSGVPSTANDTYFASISGMEGIVIQPNGAVSVVANFLPGVTDSAANRLMHAAQNATPTIPVIDFQVQSILGTPINAATPTIAIKAFMGGAVTMGAAVTEQNLTNAVAATPTPLYVAPELEMAGGSKSKWNAAQIAGTSTPGIGQVQAYISNGTNTAAVTTNTPLSGDAMLEVRAINYLLGTSVFESPRSATNLSQSTLNGTLNSYTNTSTGMPIALMMGWDSTGGAQAYRALLINSSGALHVITDNTVGVNITNLNGSGLSGDNSSNSANKLPVMPEVYNASTPSRTEGFMGPMWATLDGILHISEATTVWSANASVSATGMAVTLNSQTEPLKFVTVELDGIGGSGGVTAVVYSSINGPDTPVSQMAVTGAGNSNVQGFIKEQYGVTWPVSILGIGSSTTVTVRIQGGQ